MANLSEDIQSAGSDTRPPMLDRSDFASWQQRIRLYCMGKDNGENIIKSIDEGPFKMGKFRETLAEGEEGALHLGPERDRVFADLSPEEKDRFKADIRATNILLQGLPKDIYTLINHYTDAKDIWDNVKMLLEGSELTKDDRESQLYDEFEHFRQNKGETIHDYYVRFTKLINDMRNIKMTMPKMQLNSKFVNNMLPEWGRFVTAVKLNRGLKESNYDQLYAYLKQHEAHANENKMMLERYNQHAIDPLALVSNVSPQQYPSQSSVIPPSTYVPPGRQNRGQGNYARGSVAARNEGNPECFKDKMLLMQAQENGAVLDEEQLLFIAAGQCDAFDSNVDEAPTAHTMFMANLSSADPIYDEASSSYDSDILSEYVKDNTEKVVKSNVSFVPNDAYMMIINEMHEQADQCVSANEHNKVVNASLTAELARYKEQVELYERRAKFELNEREQKIDEQLRIIITDRNIKEENFKKELYFVKIQLNSAINHNKSMVEEVAICYKNPLYLTRAKQVQPALYNGHELIKTNHTRGVVHDSEDTLDIAKKTRIGILEKMKSTLWVDKHFEGIQKALTKEVKEMKEIFEQMEAEVDQNVVDKKSAEIERKNLLIENENLIADCLSKEVLYTATNLDFLKCMMPTLYKHVVWNLKLRFLN
ncbi:hypothetical protein Tco_1177983 [Tanacetum coccineum]